MIPALLSAASRTSCLSWCPQNTQWRSLSRRRVVGRVGRRCLGHWDRGVTLIELIVALAVIAVLVGFALPGFNSLLQRQNVTDAANGMVRAVSLARSEATSRGGNVELRAIDAADSNNEWGPGFRVLDPADAVIYQFDPVATGLSFDGPDGVSAITFNGRGLPDANLIVDLCSAGFGVRVSMSAIGRPSTSDLDEVACP